MIAKAHYKTLIGLMVVYVLHRMFFEHKTIGHDTRYAIFVFGIPTITGILILAFYRRNFLLSTFATANGFALKLFVITFYFIQGLLFSYLSFGLVANATWNYINKRTAEQNPKETIHCRVTKFSLSGYRLGGDKIEFKYQGRFESIRVEYRTIKEYLNQPLSNYELEISVQKGIWNYYVLNDWTIKTIH